MLSFLLVLLVHMGAGMWGVIAQPIFNFRTSLFYTGFEGLAWARFGWNLLGLAAIVLWTGLTSFIMFFLLNKFGIFRVSEEVELKGNQIQEYNCCLPLYSNKYHERYHCKMIIRS